MIFVHLCVIVMNVDLNNTNIFTTKHDIKLMIEQTYFELQFTQDVSRSSLSPNQLFGPVNRLQ